MAGLEGTLKVIEVTQALPALCTAHTCRADAQLAAPGGQERVTPLSLPLYVLTPRPYGASQQHQHILTHPVLLKEIPW